jgi:hypothetical protein
MGWADAHIKQLESGETVQFRPRGHSMGPRVKSGQLVTIRPFTPGEVLLKYTIVLCTVRGNQYLHMVRGWRGDDYYQIGNSRGFMNGWTKQIHGVLVSVED